MKNLLSILFLIFSLSLVGQQEEKSVTRYFNVASATMEINGEEQKPQLVPVSLAITPNMDYVLEYATGGTFLFITDNNSFSDLSETENGDHTYFNANLTSTTMIVKSELGEVEEVFSIQYGKMQVWLAVNPETHYHILAITLRDVRGVCRYTWNFE